MRFPFADALDCGIAVFGPDGRVLAWNDWLAARSGIDSGAVAGRTLAELDPELADGRLVEALAEAAGHGLSGFLSYQLAHRFLALTDPASGRALRQNVTVKPLPLAQGRGALMQIFDATRTAEREERLRARERELAHARHAAEAADRAKSAFLANISHEIRTPLSGIIGLANLLVEARLGEPGGTHAAILAKSADSLMRIVNDVLDLSSLAAGQIELVEAPFDPRELFDGALALVAPRAKDAGLSLEWRVEGELPERLTGDAGRLRQVLLNLLTNAVKFTRTGFVRLEASARPLDGGRALLDIAVVDSGPGIAPAARDRLFVAFEPGDPETARQYGGTGLGLSICRGLVERMGGTIDFAPGETGGCRFTVRVPLAAAAAEAPAPAAGPSAAALARLGAVRDRMHRRLALLLAEDNAVNSLVIEAMLPENLVDLRIVEDGAAAVSAAASGGFDLVLMDVDMPGIDGHEATRQLRRKGVATPILALTANAFESDRAAAKAAGMDAFLAKPFRKHELLDAIAAALRA